LKVRKCQSGGAKIEIFKDFLRHHRNCIDPSSVVAALGSSTFYSSKYFSFALKAIIGIKHNQGCILGPIRLYLKFFQFYGVTKYFYLTLGGGGGRDIFAPNGTCGF